MPETPPVSAQDAHVEIDGVEVIHGVSFEMEPESILGLIGPNGSGKTSLAKALVGKLPVVEGEIRVMDHSPDEIPRGEGVVGYVPQTPGLDPSLRVEETLTFFARLQGRSKAQIEDEVEYLIDVLDLGEERQKRMHQLSGGNVQRVSVAVGLVGDPDLVILDEPVSALDPVAREDVWSELERRNDEGASIVYITHDMRQAETHCDEVVALNEGERALSGPPSHLISKVPYSHVLVLEGEDPEPGLVDAEMLPGPANPTYLTNEPSEDVESLTSEGVSDVTVRPTGLEEAFHMVVDGEGA